MPRLSGYEERFFVEGLSFPDAGFPGLISFHVTLLDDSNEVRVARQRVRQIFCSGQMWAWLELKAS